MDEVRDFVSQVYRVDVAAIASFYPEWCGYGVASDGNYLSVPELPQDPMNTKYAMPGGSITGGDLKSCHPITSAAAPYFGPNAGVFLPNYLETSCAKTRENP